MRSFLAALALCLTFSLVGCDTPAEPKKDTPPIVPAPGEPKMDPRWSRRWSR